MDSKKVAIIGAGTMGKTVALAIANNTNNVCVLHHVVNSQFTYLREPEPFFFTRLPKFEEPWINPKEPVVNYKKHERTCAKNRKARKNKKRR